MPSGLSWRRPNRACPEWCTRRNGWCPAREGYPSSEHRSTPVLVAPDGRVVAVVTLSQTMTDVDTAVEVRLVLRLDGLDKAAAARRALASVAVLADQLCADLGAKIGHPT